MRNMLHPVQRHENFGLAVKVVREVTRCSQSLTFILGPQRFSNLKNSQRVCNLLGGSRGAPLHGVCRRAHLDCEDSLSEVSQFPKGGLGEIDVFGALGAASARIDDADKDAFLRGMADCEVTCERVCSR